MQSELSEEKNAIYLLLIKKSVILCIYGMAFSF
jgi:hypothetical protein